MKIVAYFLLFLIFLIIFILKIKIDLNLMVESRFCNQITSNIFLGDFWAAYEKDFLKKNGITAILTCGKGMKSFYPNDFIYKKIQIDDFEYEDILSLFEECFQFIDSNEKVLIHCQMGVSRSPSITISYIMKKNKWKYEESHDFVKSKRSIINPNDGFVRQLKEWEKIIFHYKY